MIDEQESSEETLSVIQMDPGTVHAVDISDMTLDVDCAGRTVYHRLESVRISLIANGCAVLNEGAGTEEERAAQEEATKSGAEPESEPATSEGVAADRMERFLKSSIVWAQRHWQWLLGILIGIAGLVWFVRIFENRRVAVLLTGLPSAGKTDLWLALKDGAAPRSNSAPTIGKGPRTSLEPAPFGKYTLYPTALDSAGSEPWHVANELRKSRYSVRWKSKTILVVVVSPVRGNKALGSGALDVDFVNEQRGFISLPKALIGTASKRSRPHMVMLFITKFDLVSEHSPSDSGAKSRREELEAVFDKHQRELETACDKAGIPFAVVIGSAKHGWGVDEAKRSMQRNVIKL